ncbi:MAG: GntR family transcriptional regulator [Bacillota bacterium]
MEIDFKSHIPLHVQIRIILEQEIMNGIHKEKIPGELELMNRFSVARSTVRQAITALVDDGILEKVHGKGTFISFKPVEEWLGSFRTYEDIVNEMGMKPNIKLITKYETSLPKEVGRTLGTDKFYLIQRVRYANDIPIGVEYYYYPLEIGYKLSQHNLENTSTYNLLENEVGLKLWEAKQIITARVPTPEECGLLNIPDSMWVLFIERINYDQEGNTIEYEQSVYRPDMYAFVVSFDRKKI